MATTKNNTAKKKSPTKPPPAKRSGRADTIEKARQEAIKVTEKNLAAIEAKERGESPKAAARAKKSAKAGSKTTTAKDATRANDSAAGAKPDRAALAAIFPHPGPASKQKKAAGKKDAKAKPAKSRKERKPGVLDAAVMILKGAKEPMGCHEMIEAMFEKKIWSSDGQTPHATLYAAIIREISAKGKESRFEKVDRGRFQLRVRKGVA